jgi:hypothetical protein
VGSGGDLRSTIAEKRSAIAPSRARRSYRPARPISAESRSALVWVIFHPKGGSCAQGRFGFLGSHLCEQRDVRPWNGLHSSTATFSTAQSRSSPFRMPSLRGDALRGLRSVREFVAGPGKYCRNNVAGSLTLLKAMRDQEASVLQCLRHVRQSRDTDRTGGRAPAASLQCGRRRSRQRIDEDYDPKTHLIIVVLDAASWPS